MGREGLTAGVSLEVCGMKQVWTEARTGKKTRRVGGEKQVEIAGISLLWELALPQHGNAFMDAFICPIYFRNTNGLQTLWEKSPYIICM